MKFGLHRVSIWVNIQKKFQVPRSHSFGEKCDANFKLSSHFSHKTVRPRNMKFGLHRVSISVNIQKKNKFISRTVSEKSAMLISSYHRIFLQNCVTEEHKIWFA